MWQIIFAGQSKEFLNDSTNSPGNGKIVRSQDEGEYDPDAHLSDADFRLSAFGIAEPVRYKVRWLWVTSFVVGGMLLAVPAIYRRRLRP